LLQALTSDEPVVLLIDEIDRADAEFEAFLLEVLSDFQVSVRVGHHPRPAPSPGAAHQQQHPLDIKPGKSARTRTKDYLWVHSYDSGHTQSLLLERVVGVDVSDETFDPAEIMAGWKDQSPAWNVPREW
jgi:hypothetical protein